MLVTGAKGALGSTLVQKLLDAGAEKILALDKVPVDAAERVIPLTCDITNARATDALLKETLATHPVHALINNAGILHSAPLVQMLSRDEARFAHAADRWHQVIDANLSAIFYITQRVADHMARARTKGVIVNISSIAAHGTAGQSAYAASKAGVNALTQVWAKELGVMGIRCVAVAPGYMDTPSTHKAVSESQLQQIIERVPLKSLGSTENVAQAVLTAIENDYMNGNILEVDGGLRL